MITERINRKLAFLCSAAFLVATFTSCEEEDTFEPAPTGNLRGKIHAEDQFGRPLYDERGGVMILLEGGFYEWHATSDGTGEFNLSNLEGRDYKMTLEKPGFADYTRNLEFSLINPIYPVFNGAQNMGNVIMTKRPENNIENLEIEVNGVTDTAQVSVSGEISPAPPQPGLKHGYRMFLHNNPTVADTSYLFQKHATTAAQFEENFTLGLLKTFGFQNGDAIYAIVYGASSEDRSFTYRGELQFPTLSDSTSQVANTVLP